MKIANDARREDYTAGAAQTVFPYSFAILASAELDVYIDDALQSEGADYTVTGSGSESGGNVTLVTPAAGGEIVSIVGDRAYERLTDFATGQQALLAADLNTELASQAIQLQQLSRDLQRCLRPPVQDVAPGFLLGNAAARAGKYLKFADPSGDAELAEVTASTTELSQSVIAGFLFPQTTRELNAGITPTNLNYFEGNVKRYGAVGDGATDDTAAFADVLTTGGFDIYIPAGTYEIDPGAIDAANHILIGSNTRIYCEPGVTLRCPTGSGLGVNRGFFRFRDESNLVWIGNRCLIEWETKPATDEGRHCLDIRGGQNVYIENVRTLRAGGDGFFIGPGVTNEAYNITLVHLEAEDCRRQGMSITGGRNIRLYGARFININGTAPEYGIDIEPDANTALYEGFDIYIDGVYTENCTAAIGIALQNLNGALDKKVSIVIKNCTDSGSALGYVARGSELGAGNFSGRVTFENCTAFDNDNSAFRITNWPVNGPICELIRPVAVRPNTIASASESLGSAFLITDDDTDDSLSFHGNVVIDSPTIVDEDGNVTNYIFAKGTKTGSDDSGLTSQAALTDTTRAFTVNGLIGAKLSNTTQATDGIITANTATTVTASGVTWDDGDAYVISQLVKDVHVRGHINFSGQTDPGTMITFDGSGSISPDERRELTTVQTSSPLTLRPSNYTRYINNEGAVATVEIDLDNFPPDCPEVTFEVKAAQILRIDPDANSDIQPGSGAPGNYIQSSTIGHRVTLRRESRTAWYITEEIGAWTRQ